MIHKDMQILTFCYNSAMTCFQMNAPVPPRQPLSSLCVIKVLEEAGVEVSHCFYFLYQQTLGLFAVLWVLTQKEKSVVVKSSLTATEATAHFTLI